MAKSTNEGPIPLHIHRLRLLLRLKKEPEIREKLLFAIALIDEELKSYEQ